MNTCYMCEEASSTREHVPPRSFFPAEFRTDLWTVPSCPQHNHANAKDVEYVRSIFALNASTNQLARQLVGGPIKRSWAGSPRLKSQTFKRWVPAILAGQKTGIVEADFTRVENVTYAIAYGIYYRDFKQRFPGTWMVYSTSMLPGKLVFDGQSDPFNPSLRHLLAQVPYADRPVPHPEVFQYAFHIEDAENLIYQFTFYGGSVLHAVSTPLSG
jgi:hypothetical protein